MTKSLIALSALLVSTSAAAQSAAPAAPDPQALRSSVETLVSFGTRHTLSDADDPDRGIGAAR
ncbi:MAG TPA: hypothetical protein VFJ13_02295, partial [Paracoccaceae bacterium]|nr:hypothetical protein [Paracoccaceae bacterium]